MTLLLYVMLMDNSIVRVTQHLRALADAQLPGERLPSVRALMHDLRVSPVTVQRALDQLARQGVLDTRPGRGTFVAVPAKAPDEPASDLAWQSMALGPGRALTAALGSLALAPSENATALNVGYLPEELRATSLLVVASARAVRRPGIWGRMPPEGLADLRAWFAAEAGGSYQPHEVTICPGTQAANAAAFRALASPGDPVLVESPTYLGAIAAARAAGLRLVPVPMDADGVRPDLLADAFKRTGARLFYCQPTHANPTGAVLSPSRRVAVLDAARAAGAFVVEDDWARDFHFSPPPPPPPLAADDRDGHVVYVRSLTKSAAPGLRIGAICGRGAVLERLRAARLVDDFFVPGVLQETALQLVTAPSWPRHLRALRTALQQRRDGMVAALHRHFGPECLPTPPSGGLHLWVRLPDRVSDAEVVAAALTQGILASAGRDWFPAEAPAPYLRLSFAAACPDTVDSPIARLAEIVRTF